MRNFVQIRTNCGPEMAKIGPQVTNHSHLYQGKNKFKIMSCGLMPSGDDCWFRSTIALSQSTTVVVNYGKLHTIVAIMVLW